MSQLLREHCIASLDPKDRGTERQFRFTRALLCTLLGVKSDNTISNHIEALIKRGVIEVVKNLTTLKIPTNGGMQEREYSADLAEYSESRRNPNLTVISESGLYRILAKCNLPKCEPWFVAKDACDCLELGNVSQTCSRLDDDERGYHLK